jgi:hypothetical protein
MKKLRLELDRLAVESFATGEKTISSGTVRGFVTTTTQPVGDTQESCDATCGGNATIYITCGVSCYSCNMTPDCSQCTC